MTWPLASIALTASLTAVTVYVGDYLAGLVALVWFAVWLSAGALFGAAARWVEERR